MTFQISIVCPCEQSLPLRRHDLHCNRRRLLTNAFQELTHARGRQCNACITCSIKPATALQSEALLPMLQESELFCPEYGCEMVGSVMIPLVDLICIHALNFDQPLQKEYWKLHRCIMAHGNTLPTSPNLT